MVPPKAMAPIYIAESKCPIKIMSTNPNKGIVMLLIMLGIASFSMDLFILKYFSTKIQKMMRFYDDVFLCGNNFILQ